MNFFTGISKLNKGQMLALIDAAALALSEGLNDDDLNTTGSFLTAVSDIMLTFPTLNSNNN